MNIPDWQNLTTYVSLARLMLQAKLPTFKTVLAAQLVEDGVDILFQVYRDNTDHRRVLHVLWADFDESLVHVTDRIDAEIVDIVADALGHECWSPAGCPILEDDLQLEASIGMTCNGIPTTEVNLYVEQLCQSVNNQISWLLAQP